MKLSEINDKIHELFNSIKNLTSNLSDTKTNLEKEIKSINDGIPYENFNNQKSELEGKIYNYSGFSNFTKRTYGRFQQACVASIIANSDKCYPGILGTNTAGLSQYLNRDSCSLYIENNGTKPILSISSGCTFTNNSIVLPSTIDMSNIKIGMIVDVGTTTNSDWCVGIIKNINGNTLIMEDGFYQVRDDDTKTKITPISGSSVKIQNNNKLWGINLVMHCTNDVPSACGLELDVNAPSSNINDVGGIDVLSVDKAIHYGYKTRGNIIDCFVEKDGGNSFVSESKNDDDFLLLSRDDNKNIKFGIKKDGTNLFLKSNFVIFEKNGTIPNLTSFVFANANDINLTLPKPTNGQFMIIISNSTGVLITAQNGNSISNIDAIYQQISCSKASGHTHRAMIFIGYENVWFLISDNY